MVKITYNVISEWQQNGGTPISQNEQRGKIFRVKWIVVEANEEAKHVRRQKRDDLVPDAHIAEFRLKAAHVADDGLEKVGSCM